MLAIPMTGKYEILVVCTPLEGQIRLATNRTAFRFPDWDKPFGISAPSSSACLVKYDFGRGSVCKLETISWSYPLGIFYSPSRILQSSHAHHTGALYYCSDDLYTLILQRREHPLNSILKGQRHLGIGDPSLVLIMVCVLRCCTSWLPP